MTSILRVLSERILLALSISVYRYAYCNPSVGRESYRRPRSRLRDTVVIWRWPEDTHFGTLLWRRQRRVGDAPYQEMLGDNITSQKYRNTTGRNWGPIFKKS